MKTIFFHIFPALSHLYSSFKIARVLKEYNYNIIYICIEKYKPVIEEAGFNFELIYNLEGCSTLEMKDIGIKRYIRKRYLEMTNDIGYKNLNLNIASLKEKITRMTPDLVFIDVHHIMIGAIYLHLGCKTKESTF